MVSGRSALDPPSRAVFSYIFISRASNYWQDSPRGSFMFDDYVCGLQLGL